MHGTKDSIARRLFDVPGVGRVTIDENLVILEPRGGYLARLWLAIRGKSTHRIERRPGAIRVTVRQKEDVDHRAMRAVITGELPLGVTCDLYVEKVGGDPVFLGTLP